MFDYSKEKYGCFITSTKDEIAYVDVCENNGKKSFMEIPFEHLKNNGIECNAGIIFSFILKSFLGWGKLIFTPIIRKPWTREKIEATRKHYAEKYKDI